MVVRLIPTYDVVPTKGGDLSSGVTVRETFPDYQSTEVARFRKGEEEFARELAERLTIRALARGPVEIQCALGLLGHRCSCAGASFHPMVMAVAS